ncbi:terpenoid synthase [Biscogniauxia marginata]|nr:terpenoid synthase [Biscogniauxia marginata]
MRTTTCEGGVAPLDDQHLPSVGYTRKQLVALIRGSRITIPDLELLMSHWPHGVHPDIDKLEQDVQRSLESIFSSNRDNSRLQKMNATKVALFGASWWAYAPLENLRIATQLSIWLFVWDDETDSSEFSAMVHDFAKASRFRAETVSYLRKSLARSSKGEATEASTNPIITCFGPVGAAISKACNDRQVKRFLDELLYFVEMCEDEQKSQTTPHLPTIEEYMRRRMGSSAVRVCMAIMEYASGITLSEQILNDASMQVIWHETNMIISTTNDILSIKKEIAQSQTDTLIPLLLTQLGSVQAAVNQAVEIVRLSIHRFEAAEQNILQRYSCAPDVQADIRRYVEGCKFACTANLKWSLTSGRYKLNCTSLAGGLDITL